MSLLLAQGLRKSFGETRAVNGVDFRVEPEELISLVGSNGGTSSERCVRACM